MKKFFSLLLALCLVLSLSAAALAADGIAPEDLKVGMVCIGDENSGYDIAHLTGLKTAMEETGVPEDNLIPKYNVGENEQAADACYDLAESGCQIIFTDSYGHQSYTQQVASEYPDIQFCAMTGDQAGLSGLDNLANAFNHTFESRYVSGVVAGMKIAELLENEALADANYDADGNVKIGYVGAFNYAEVVSGYTAFFLGIRSVVENVHMDVRYTNSWYDPIAEAAAADALMADGCVIISQHADSTGAPSAVQAYSEAGHTVFCVGYNIDMQSVAPDTALTSAGNDWSKFYTFALQSMIDGQAIPHDWSAGYSEQANFIFPLNETACAEGTAEKVAEVEAALADGSLQVFDCSTFTVEGEHPESFLALDLDGDFVGDEGEAIRDGIFYESDPELRSAPYFSLRIDGITELS